MGALADRIGIKNMLVLSFIVYSAVYALPGHRRRCTSGSYSLHTVYTGYERRVSKAYLALISPKIERRPPSARIMP